MQYADNSSCLVDKFTLAKELMKTTKKCVTFSGLKRNSDKNKVEWSVFLKEYINKPLGITWPLKLDPLTIYLSTRSVEKNKVNFEDQVTEIKQFINVWSAKRLIVYKRIPVIKRIKQ